MSYSQNYHQRIGVHYSGSVSYPASQNGGSVSYSGVAYEDVYVNINVDTNPFDQSINHCNNTVNGLTGAVVATQTAQVASIQSNSKRVAKTIIDGFFKTVRSEISQQILELSKKIDAHLLHLKELAKSCIDKQRQMEIDYNRVSARYLKIFDDLNKELYNRVYELNKPAFAFKDNTDKHAIRTTGNDLVATVSVFGSESGELHSKISASIVKKLAFNAIELSNNYLVAQKKLNNTINQSMFKENVSSKKYYSACFIEAYIDKNQTGTSIYQPDYFSTTNSIELIEKFRSQSWIKTSKETTDNIQRYFNIEISNAYSSGDQHENRVREMIAKIFDINSIKCI